MMTRVTARQAEKEDFRILTQKLEKVDSRADLVDFIHCLIEFYSSDQVEWRNRAADSYLEALSAWLSESDIYYAFRGEKPLLKDLHWRNLAEMLLAATNYE